MNIFQEYNLRIKCVTREFSWTARLARSDPALEATMPFSCRAGELRVCTYYS